MKYILRLRYAVIALCLTMTIADIYDGRNSAAVWLIVAIILSALNLPES